MRPMRVVMAALVASAGCAQVLGLDETSGLDANADLASLQIQRVSLGATVVRSPQDLSSQAAVFLQDNGAGGFVAVPGTLGGDALDTFTADVPGTPPVAFTLPDTSIDTKITNRLWALPARQQRGLLVVSEHPGATPPVATSQLGVMATLPSAYVASESFYVQAVGAWSQFPLGPTNLPAPATGATAITTTIPYDTFTPMTASPIARITSADVVLLLRYAGNRLTGVLQAQFDQTDGTDPLSGTMAAVPATEPLTATLAPATFSTRFSAVRPAVSGLGLTWRITAAPGWSIASDQGVVLHDGTLTPMDTMVSEMFSNPFESLDWRSVFTFSALSTRTHMFTQGTTTVPVSLEARLRTLAAVAPATPIPVDMPCGLPTTIRANLVMLATDGMTLPVAPDAPVSVEVLVDRPSNTLYQMIVVELGISTTGTTSGVTRKTVLELLTTSGPTGSATFTIPPGVLAVGTSYYVKVRAFQGGFTEAASGDLQTVSLPFSVGSFDSAVFTVEAL